jgi:L-fuculose-phosphate aldolase
VSVRDFGEDEIRTVVAMVMERLSLEPGCRSLTDAEEILRREESLGRDRIVALCGRLGDLGFFAGTSGNVSVRLSDGRILITPSGLYKGTLCPDDIVTVDGDGNILEGARKPTSEMKMHLAIYRKRSDVAGIIHGHPPYATGFAAARVTLERKVLPEAILILGPIPLVEYSTPSTDEVPSNLIPHLAGADTFLLASHGALTLGRTLEEAGQRMETLELYAKILLVARLLGGEALLSEEELRRLGEAHDGK